MKAREESRPGLVPPPPLRCFRVREKGVRVRQRRWNVLSSLLSASAFGLRNRRRPVAVAVVVTTVVTAVVAAVVEAGIVVSVASSVLKDMGDQVVRPPPNRCVLFPRSYDRRVGSRLSEAFSRSRAVCLARSCAVCLAGSRAVCLARSRAVCLSQSRIDIK